MVVVLSFGIARAMTLRQVCQSLCDAELHACETHQCERAVVKRCKSEGPGSCIEDRTCTPAAASVAVAGAVTLRGVCESLCDAELQACETRKCERQVLRRCKREGPEECIERRACTPTTTTTTTPDGPTTTVPGGPTTTTVTTPPTTTLPPCVATSGTFCDRGDGTVYDSATNLVWEKKTAEAGLRSVAQSYYTGEEEARALNDADFAGHNDWRTPSEASCNSCYVLNSCSGCGVHELETILLPVCETSPCIDPIFGPAAEYYYWTRTPNPNGVGRWAVDFRDGNVVLGGGHCEFGGVCTAYARAVRNGP